MTRPKDRTSKGAWTPERRLQGAGAIFLGVLGLDVLGVAPVLLGALQEAGRISAPQIGETAMAELLAMGSATALAGALLPPRALRRTGALACGTLALLDGASTTASGGGLVLLRALAGLPEGLLIWITVGMIARTAVPERWAGVYFTAQTFAQLLLAALFWLLVLPRFGPNGGFVTLAATSLLGLPAAVLGPRAFAPLAARAQPAGAPPRGGWIALAACFFLVAGNGAVSVYLQPLASEGGLGAQVARLANVVSLIAQVAGGAVATACAGRISYLPVFTLTSLGFLLVWFLYGRAVAAPVFIAATGLAGFLALLVGPFLTPMMIEADPSRRAAMQSAGAQIFGGAAGPLAAAALVSDQNVRAVLPLATASLLIGLGLVFLIKWGRARA